MKKTSINLCSLVDSDRRIRVDALPERKGFDVREHNSTDMVVLRGPAAVDLQQPAQLLFAANVGHQGSRFIKVREMKSI